MWRTSLAPCSASNPSFARSKNATTNCRRPDRFQLTDPGADLTGELDHAHYCIKCHDQGKDSFSTALREKDGSFKSSVFRVKLAGCPLVKKISEMNTVKEQAKPIAALA